MFGENFTLGLRILSAADNVLEEIMFCTTELQRSVFCGIMCYQIDVNDPLGVVILTRRGHFVELVGFYLDLRKSPTMLIQ